MSKERNLIIEKGLPPDFIFDLGLYLQTCSHIELQVCVLILAVEKRLGSHPLQTKRFHELRKLPAAELLRELKAIVPHFQDESWRGFLGRLLDWLGEYKSNRHIAAHGAFYPPDKDGVMRVVYTHVRKDHGQKFYYPEEARITRALVRELIEDADRILRLVTRLAVDVESGEIKIDSQRN